MSNAALGPQVASQTMGFYTTDVPFEVAKARFFHHMDGCLLLQWMAFVDSLIRWMLRFSMSGCFLAMVVSIGTGISGIRKSFHCFFFKKVFKYAGRYAKSGAYGVAFSRLALITAIKPDGRKITPSAFSSRHLLGIPSHGIINKSCITNTRWWQLKYFLFSPLLGEDSHFD